MRQASLITISVITSIFIMGTLNRFGWLTTDKIKDDQQEVATEDRIKNIEERLKILETSDQQADASIKEISRQTNTDAACSQAENLMAQIKEQCGSMPFPGIEECIEMRTKRAEVELKEQNLERVEKMKKLNDEYLIVVENCL